MQPYFVPYLGYFQLMHAADLFVVYDDVQFIKGGWINRNRILFESKWTYINIPMIGASSNKLINEVGSNFNLVDFFAKVENSYRNAPFFIETYNFLHELLGGPCFNSLSESLTVQLERFRTYFDLKCEIVVSSQLTYDRNLKGEDRVIEICKQCGATEYINLSGGKTLYSKRNFRANKIDLVFTEMRPIEYRQFDVEYIPNLSIIDVLMFNDLGTVKEYLKNYNLV